MCGLALNVDRGLLGPDLHLTSEHLLLVLVQVVHLLVVVFHPLDLGQFGDVEALVQPGGDRGELETVLALVAIKLEPRSLLAHHLLEHFLVKVQHVRNLDRPLAVEFQVVDELFPDVVVVEDELEE